MPSHLRRPERQLSSASIAVSAPHALDARAGAGIFPPVTATERGHHGEGNGKRTQAPVGPPADAGSIRDRAPPPALTRFPSRLLSPGGPPVPPAHHPIAERPPDARQHHRPVPGHPRRHPRPQRRVPGRVPPQGRRGPRLPRGVRRRPDQGRLDGGPHPRGVRRLRPRPHRSLGHHGGDQPRRRQLRRLPRPDVQHEHAGPARLRGAAAEVPAEDREPASCACSRWA